MKNIFGGYSSIYHIHNMNTEWAISNMKCVLRNARKLQLCFIITSEYFHSWQLTTLVMMSNIIIR